MAQVPLAPSMLDLVPVLSRDNFFSSLLAHRGSAIQLTSHTGMQIDMSEAAVAECFILNESWQAACVL